MIYFGLSNERHIPQLGFFLYFHLMEMENKTHFVSALENYQGIHKTYDMTQVGVVFKYG